MAAANALTIILLSKETDTSMVYAALFFCRSKNGKIEMKLYRKKKFRGNDLGGMYKCMRCGKRSSKTKKLRNMPWV